MQLEGTHVLTHEHVHSTAIMKKNVTLLTNYLRLVVFSYLGADDLLYTVARLNRQTRKQIINSEGNLVTSRLFAERTVKIVISSERQARMPYPRDIVDFADKLIIQSTSPLKCRGQILEGLFREMPSRFNNLKVKLYSNELPPVEMIN